MPASWRRRGTSPARSTSRGGCPRRSTGSPLPGAGRWSGIWTTWRRSSRPPARGEPGPFRVHRLCAAKLFIGGADVKIRILASIALTLAVLAAAALWTLRTVLPRVRPKTPLERAAVSGSSEELRREVRIMGGVNAMDGHGFTPLDWAARTGRTDVIRELVREGAAPDLRDEGPNGWAPLHHAVHKGQPAAVRALIAAGADPNRRGDNGLTPLMLAAAQGEPEIVEDLLAAGAD